MKTMGMIGMLFTAALVVVAGCSSSNGGGGGGGQPAGGCTGGEVAASLRSGCCVPSNCSTGTGKLLSCADTSSEVWFETGGKLYGPCASSDQSCTTTAATNATQNCH